MRSNQLSYVPKNRGIVQEVGRKFYQGCYNERMAKKQSFASENAPTILVVLFALIVLVGGLWAWHRYVFMDAERTFWSTVDANLQAYGVTKNLTQEEANNKVDRFVQLQFGDPTVVRDVSVIEQENNGQETKVISEVLGTKDQNFIRYRQLDAPSANGARDFSDVVGRWAVEDVGDGSNVQSAALRDAIIGSVYGLPFANVSPTQRQELVKFMKDSNVYSADFNATSILNRDGKTYYQYNVTTNVSAYIAMIQKLDAMIGLNQLQQLQPSDYESEPDVEIVMVIDPKARQLTELTYKQVGQQERYSGYGARIVNELPEPELSRQELEGKIQSVLGN